MQQELEKEFARAVFQLPEPTIQETARQTAVGLAPLFGFDPVTGINLGATARIDKQVRDIITEDNERQARQQASAIFEAQKNFVLRNDALMWRGSVLDYIVSPEGKTIRTAKDLEAVMKNPLNMTNADKTWLNNLLFDVQAGRNARALSKEEIEVQEQTAIERRAKYLKQLDKRRSISAYGLAAASGASLNAIIREVRTPQLDADTTLEDLRLALRDADLEEALFEELLTESEISEGALIADNYANVNAKSALLLQDISGQTPEDLAELIRAGTMDTIFEKGALGLLMLQPIEYYTRLIEKYIIAPLTPSILLATGANPASVAMQELVSPLWSVPVLGSFRSPYKGFKPTERVKLYNEFQAAYRIEREAGADFFTAMNFARDNSNMTGWEKFMQLIALDPLTYFGWGLYGKILKPLPLVGPALGGTVAGLEVGYARAVDRFFLGMARKGTFLGGKLVKQLINQEVRDSISTVYALIGKTTGKSPVQADYHVIRAKLHEGLNEVIANPFWTSPQADIARYMLRRAPLNEAEVIGVATRLQHGLGDNILLQDGILTGVDDIFQHTVGLGGDTFKIPEAAHLLATRLGIVHTDEALGRIADEILAYQGSIRRTAEAMFTAPYGNTLPQMVDNLSTHLEQVITKTRASQLAVVRARQGSLGAWMKWAVPETMLVAQSKLDVVSRMAARQYLVFTAYGFGNVLEAMIKTWLAGITIPWGTLKTPFGFGSWRDVIIGELHKVSWGLTGLDPKFIDGTPSLLEIQLGRDAASLARPGQLSANTLNRRWQQTTKDFAKKLSPFDEHGFLQETFIRKPGRIGLALEANYMTKQLLNAMEDIAPNALTRARTIVFEELQEPRLQKALAPKELEAYIAEMQKRSYTSSEQLMRDLAEDFHMGVIDQKQVGELLVKAQTMSPEVHDMLLEASRTGPMWANIDGVFANARARTLIELLNSPQVMRRSFIDMVDEALRHAPVTPEDMVHRLKVLTGLVEEYQTNLGIQFHLVQSQMNEYPGTLAKRAFLDNNWDAQMGPLMDAAEEQVNRVVNQLRPIAQNPLSPIRVLQGFFSIEGLLDANLNVIQAIRKVRITQANAEDVVIRRFGGKVARNDVRFDNFTNQMFEARLQAWTQGLPEIHGAWGRVETLADQISGAALPPATVLRANPTPLDIASLFSSHPHDLVRGLYIPERGMWRTKDEFVMRVMGRARQVAAGQGSNPLDLGYTNEAVGRVYDQIVSHVGDQPVFAELESIKAEIIKYGQQRGALMAPETHDLLVEASERIVNRLKNDPETAVMFLDEPEVVELITQVDHAIASEVVEFAGNPEMAALKPENPIDTHLIPVDELSEAFTDVGREKLKAQGFDGIRTASGDIQGFNLVESSTERLADRMTLDAWRENVNSIANEAFDTIKSVGGDEAAVLNGLIEQSMAYLPLQDLEDIAFDTLIMRGVNEIWIDQKHVVLRKRPLDPRGRPMEGPTSQVFSSSEWEDFIRDQITFDMLLGHWSSFAIQLGVDFPVRDIIGQIAMLPSLAAYRTRVHTLLREVFGSELTVFRGVDQAGLTRLGGEEVANVVSVTTQAKTGMAFGDHGFTDAGKIGVEDVLAVGNLGEGELLVESSVFRPWSETIDQGTRKGRSWTRDVRQPAMNRAKDAFRLDFPNYDDETIFNSVARTVFPFWSYEAHRWPWLAREMFRHPGVVANWGRYMDNTELGYIPLPSNLPFGLSDLQFNPLRGTIFMGGMRRLLMQDFPEYYDNMPGVANAFDWISRFGFYPNIWIGTAMATIGPRLGPLQLGELLPPIAQTPLDIYLATNPDSWVAKRLTSMVFNNRFRDYQSAQFVSAEGGNGPEILNKIRLGIPLTPEEEQAWARGQRDTARLNISMTQLPLFRLRPAERQQFQRDAEKMIEELTGVSIATQREMRKAGMWLEDYVPLHPQHAEFLRQLDGWTRWGGLTTHLRETMTGQAQALWRRFWLDNTEHREMNLAKQKEWDKRLAEHWLGRVDPEGQVDMGTWEFQRRDLGSNNRVFFDSLRESSLYQWKNPKTGAVEPVPVSLEERVAAAELLGYEAPIMHPIEEAQAILFSRDIEDFTGPDLDTGNLQVDWEKFYNWQDSVLDAMRPDLRQELEEWLSRNLSAGEKLRKADWDMWIIPYKATRNVALAEFEPEEQAQIKQFIQSKDATEIAQLREIVRTDGTKLISSYSSTLNTIRSNIRTVDPEMDARLALWGETTSLKTPTAESRFEELKQQYAQVILNS